ncbi:MAG: hypothetical protein GX549_02880 [Clostridiales bacterium]|nr:hypothetical protein [Clostridiales bacterium]
MEPAYVKRLSYSFRKRRKKLIKHKRRMQMSIMLGFFSGALALLALFIGNRSLAAYSGQPERMLESAGTAAGRSFVAAVIMLLCAAVIALYAIAHYAYIKRKFDTLRHSTQDHFGTQDVCDCYVSTCTCEDDFIEDMDKNYDINLSY